MYLSICNINFEMLFKKFISLNEEHVFNPQGSSEIFFGATSVLACVHTPKFNYFL